MKRIHVLSSALANQIAAGEVVVRPASVVKELLENSFDAKSRSITVTIKKGGVGLIRVEDDGEGIVKEDLALTVERHATSKIKETEDLFAINTLGFRGEALASVNAVSRLNLCSKTATEKMGWQMHWEGGKSAHEPQPIAMQVGTVIEVNDLFFNVPARRKFLRSEKTERQHIEALMKSLALSHFEIGFRLFDDNKCLYHYPPAEDELSRRQRLQKLLGKPFIERAKWFERETSELRLCGWIMDPEYSRSQTDQQFFYVNHRLVKDKLLQHAVRQAYGDKLYPGQHAIYVLYLTCDARQVDVNVHPTKYEVRFYESRLVHDFVYSTVSQQLTPVSTGDPKTLLCEEPRPVYQVTGSKALATHSQRQSTKFGVPPEFGKWLGVAHERHLLLETEKGLFIIDAIKAHTFLIQQRYTTKEETIGVRPLLIPLVIPLESAMVPVAEKQKAGLRTLGFDYEWIAPTSIQLKHIPSFLIHSHLSPLMQNMFRCLPNHSSTLEGSTRKKLIAMIAEHEAKQLPPTREEHEKLLQTLAQHCEHRPQALDAQLVQFIAL